jgi:nucleoid DNA-binding protein
MKLKELNEAIATACNVRPQVVTAVQAETFRRVRASLDQGEKVVIPDFGIFITKDVAAEGDQPAKKVVRFKTRTEAQKKAREAAGGPKKREKGKKETSEAG